MAATKLERQSARKKTILIVDDHPILPRGLAALIDSEPDLAVFATAATLPAALQAVEARQFDLIIVDIALAKDDGLDLVKELKRSHSQMASLVLSMHDEAMYAERALRAGAQGYVTKQQLDETVLAAIRCVLKGETYMSDALVRRLAGKYMSGGTLGTDSSLNTLSDRELQVFRLIGEGRTTRQIAGALALSIKTIESHREHIKDKLTIQSSAELAQRAACWVETGRSS